MNNVLAFGKIIHTLAIVFPETIAETFQRSLKRSKLSIPRNVLSLTLAIHVAAIPAFRGIINKRCRHLRCFSSGKLMSLNDLKETKKNDEENLY